MPIYYAHGDSIDQKFREDTVKCLPSTIPGGFFIHILVSWALGLQG